MSRGLERKILIAGSLWNVITSLLTIFSYNTWFQQEGSQQFENLDRDTYVLGTHLIENISRIIMLFGLFIFVGAIINFLIAIKMEDHTIQKHVIIWIAFWGIVQLISMDLIGVIIFTVAFVIYIARNKAIRLAEEGIE